MNKESSKWDLIKYITYLYSVMVEFLFLDQRIAMENRT